MGQCYDQNYNNGSYISGTYDTGALYSLTLWFLPYAKKIFNVPYVKLLDILQPFVENAPMKKQISKKIVLTPLS